MPLITRKIVVENTNTSFMKDVVDHTFYVPKNQMKPGDVIAQPYSDVQLAELAQLYPDEYGEQAKKAGIKPAQGVGRLEQLKAMNAKELERQIRDMNQDTDGPILWELYEAEVADGDEDADPPVPAGKNRVTILDALAQKGVVEK